jgi:hypothetical protein
VGFGFGGFSSQTTTGFSFGGFGSQTTTGFSFGGFSSQTTSFSFGGFGGQTALFGLSGQTALFGLSGQTSSVCFGLSRLVAFLGQTALFGLGGQSTFCGQAALFLILLGGQELHQASLLGRLTGRTFSLQLGNALCLVQTFSLELGQALFFGPGGCVGLDEFFSRIGQGNGM